VSHRGQRPTENLKHFAADQTKTMVVVDPRVTDTSRSAAVHLRLKPGSDCYLLLAMIKVILDADLVDAEFVRARTTGYDDVRKAFAHVDVADMAERCAVGVDALTDVATRFATSGASSILFDLGVEQTRFSTLISYLLRLLLALTGNLGRRGGNVYIESVVPPETGKKSRERETERSLVAGIPAIRALGDFAMFSPTLVPEEVLADSPERLRALIVEGSNPLLSYSDSRRWREAAEHLDLLVVIDPAFTETARLAHYVLPTPVGYEKWEFAIFPRGYPEIYAQVRPPVVAGPAEALPEPEIYVRLAEAMGLYGEAPAVVRSLAGVAHLRFARAVFFLAAAGLAKRRSTSPTDDGTSRLLFWLYRLVGPSLPAPALAGIYLLCHANALVRRDDVVRALGPQWKRRTPFGLAAELFRRILTHPQGVEVARLSTADNLGDHIGFEDKRVRLLPEPLIDEITRAVRTRPQVDARYPFVLATGLRTRWTANTIQRDPAWRKGRGPHCTLSLSPADAERLGVKGDDIVRVETPRNAVELPVLVDDRLQAGHVSIPNGFGMIQKQEGERLELDGVNINELTDTADRDPFTGCPHHKYVPCRVEKVSGV
jgi:formate dehydrogenase